MATGQYILLDGFWQILGLIFPHSADVGSGGEHCRCKARPEKFTRENRTLPTIHLGPAEGWLGLVV